ncbi:hypothetical protein ACHAXS_008758 [Conticribra weissflogii]
METMSHFSPRPEIPLESKTRGGTRPRTHNQISIIFLLSVVVLAFISLPSEAFPCRPFTNPTTPRRITRLDSPLRIIRHNTGSNVSNDSSSYSYVEIRDAIYSDLSSVAELMTFGFHPELTGNPIMRPLRILLELDRLQSNFPYNDKNHTYLVACTKKKDVGEYKQSNGNGEEPGKIVGFCDIDGRKFSVGYKQKISILTAHPKAVKQRPYLSDLAVHPDHRRQGIASALMAEAEGRARKMGFDELFLGVTSSNKPALKMYTGMGYDKKEPKSVVIETDQNKKKTDATILLRRSLHNDNEAL